MSERAFYCLTKKNYLNYDKEKKQDSTTAG